MAQRMMPGGIAPAGAAAPAAVAPPPPPTAAVWYIARDGQTQGPFSFAQIREALSSGQITAQTHLWTAGMPAWLPAAQVPQLAAQFMPTPPPPPA